MPTGTEWKVATKFYILEVSYEMFTSNMQSFILNVIYIGSQTRHIFKLLDLKHAMYFSKMVIHLHEMILITQTTLKCVVKLSKPQYHLILVRL